MPVIIKALACLACARPTIFDPREATLVPPHGTGGNDPRTDHPVVHGDQDDERRRGHGEPPSREPATPERGGGHQAGSREYGEPRVAQPSVDGAEPRFGSLLCDKPGV